MSFHQNRKRKICARRSVVVKMASIVFLLEYLSSDFWTTIFCHGHKSPSSWSSTLSSLSLKLPKPPTPKTISTTTVLSKTISDQNQIVAWVSRQATRSKPSNLKTSFRTLPCAGYYMQSPPMTGCTRIRRSALFSKRRDENDKDMGDHEKDENYKLENRNQNTKKRGIKSIFWNFRHGVNLVNKDFLRLTWKVYSRTFLCMTPFVLLLFIILPAWSKSSSPTLQLLAIQVQGFLRRTFELLAEKSRVFFVRPMHGLAELIISWCSTGSVANSGNPNAWNNRSSKRSMLIWGLLWGPVLEEFIFRFVFHRMWKVLFRPISIETKSSRTNLNHQVVHPKKSTFPVPLPIIGKIISDFRKTSRPINETKPMYSNRSWRIASGICFGIAHFSNFFPIDPSQFTMDGEIRLPSGTVRERFLLNLFPADFAATNKEFCLTSMVLVGAVYQGMHCFINTMILYGPLLDSPRSKRGGVFAAIGAHIAWNANVLWLFTNLKMRALFRIVSLSLSKHDQKKEEK